MMMRIDRRAFVASLATSAVAAPAARAAASEKVAIGYTRTATDIGLYVADKRGYFAAAGIAPDFQIFDSAARMVASVANGDLQVVAVAPSAGFFNAVARGIDIRMVADKVSTPPGRPSQTLIVRKDLMQSGRVKTVADLKGMKVANAAPGAAASVTLQKMMAMGGLTIADIQQVFMPFPQHVVALANGAVDWLAYPRR